MYFFLMVLLRPISIRTDTLLPYTTLVQSNGEQDRAEPRRRGDRPGQGTGCDTRCQRQAVAPAGGHGGAGDGERRRAGTRRGDQGGQQDEREVHVGDHRCFSASHAIARIAFMFWISSATAASDISGNRILHTAAPNVSRPLLQGPWHARAS